MHTITTNIALAVAAVIAFATACALALPAPAFADTGTDSAPDAPTSETHPPALENAIAETLNDETTAPETIKDQPTTRDYSSESGNNCDAEDEFTFEDDIWTDATDETDEADSSDEDLDDMNWGNEPCDAAWDEFDDDAWDESDWDEDAWDEDEDEASDLVLEGACGTCIVTCWYPDESDADVPHCGGCRVLTVDVSDTAAEPAEELAEMETGAEADAPDACANAFTTPATITSEPDNAALELPAEEPSATDDPATNVPVPAAAAHEVASEPPAAPAPEAPASCMRVYPATNPLFARKS